ncbi:ABC transporter ATP-binding protein [Thermovenabulum gondwanense]|uniref:High-affinity branched-chain amino acid transport ATP-binding protein LivF n=1 Tax=Thermovenabulum gondwanense TaxID=520767 RepID=A0A162MCL0_9FIRM|nr:ABC transporter ATP-binding protein [Thermovenabulum gondwanense]KYO65258.1 High-affinity branched-chain amino acid transport ATP-binding protein LivF [Thermovenabulum gondwanense]
MLNVINVNAAYGGIKALRGVSLEVNEGEVVAVLGANGAGKTTLLKVISSVMKPISGEVLFYNKKIPSVSYQSVKMGIIHVPEGRQIFPKLTVYENLMVGAFLNKDKKKVKEDLEWVYTLFPRLKERENQYGGLLSGGEQQMLAISRGLMGHPKLLLLDEPSLGLAPIIVNQIFDILKEIRKKGTSILIVEQNAYKALSIADRGYIMSTGVIEKSGTSKELLSDENLLKAYLGE